MERIKVLKKSLQRNGLCSDEGRAGLRDITTCAAGAAQLLERNGTP